jgi:hypothetical protein
MPGGFTALCNKSLLLSHLFGGLVSFSYPLLWGQVSFETLTSSDTYPLLWGQSSFETLTSSDTYPLLWGQVSFETLTSSDTYPLLWGQVSFFFETPYLVGKCIFSIRRSSQSSRKQIHPLLLIKTVSTWCWYPTGHLHPPPTLPRSSWRVQRTLNPFLCTPWAVFMCPTQCSSLTFFFLKCP